MEYSLEFAKELVQSASGLKGTGHIIEERKRVLLYLSLLSIEITLKHLLEKTGKPIKEIRGRSHNIEQLLNDVCECEIEAYIGSEKRFVPVSRIRARVVNPMFGGATLGNLLCGESKGASAYPNEIRYGALPGHFPPDLVLECAQTLINWAEHEGQSIRATENA